MRVHGWKGFELLVGLGGKSGVCVCVWGCEVGVKYVCCKLVMLCVCALNVFATLLNTGLILEAQYFEALKYSRATELRVLIYLVRYEPQNLICNFPYLSLKVLCVDIGLGSFIGFILVF